MWGSACWALGLLRSADPRLLTGVFGTAVLQSVLPAGQALVSRGLINAVVSSVQVAGRPTDDLWIWLGTGMCLGVLQAAAGLANELWGKMLLSRLDLRLTGDILAHAATLGLSFFEDPGNQDMLERAQQNPSNHIFSLVENALSGISNIAQAASLVAILLALEPLTGIVLLPIIVPYLVSQWRLARMKYAVQYARATKRRWSRYFVGRLTSRASIPEVRYS